MEQSTRTQLEITLGPNGQLTLPSQVCDELKIGAGDLLVVTMTDDGFLVTPKNAEAHAALRAVWRAFAESGITEEELQAEGRRVREEIYRERYGDG